MPNPFACSMVVFGGSVSSIRLVTTSTTAGPGCAKARCRHCATPPGLPRGSRECPQTRPFARIRVLSTRCPCRENRRPLSPVHGSERAVVNDYDLSRQHRLLERNGIAHQHGKFAFARKREHLPLRERGGHRWPAAAHWRSNRAKTSRSAPGARSSSGNGPPIPSACARRR